jgi:hypothetical protein
MLTTCQPRTYTLLVWMVYIGENKTKEPDNKEKIELTPFLQTAYTEIEILHSTIAEKDNTIEQLLHQINIAQLTKIQFIIHTLLQLSCHHTSAYININLIFLVYIWGGYN